MSNPLTFYDQQAEYLIERYDALAFETVHAVALPWLPDRPGLVLDVGAGSGRDARWFAARGHEVFAVEPAERLRSLASRNEGNQRIHWVDDRLPELVHFSRANTTFDLIWVSAVWMHLPPGDRARAFRKLANRLRPGGRMMISLRHGTFDDDRRSYPVSADEVIALARDHGLICRHLASSKDQAGRQAVSWEVVILELPDDGSGAFPTLRSIVLVDAKSSTYKLGLLRSLLQAAHGAAGLASAEADGSMVRLPLGLVALYWIRTYLPLLASNVPTLPGRGVQPAFAKSAFRALKVSPYDLRVGGTVSGEQAQLLAIALRESAKVIRKMPATYITWPNTTKPIFEVKSRRSGAVPDRVNLNAEFLAAFGELGVPAPLWDALRHHAVWIEPLLTAEWIKLLQRYEDNDKRSWEYYAGLLRWVTPEHDTVMIRQFVENLRRDGGDIRCVWSARRLPAAFDVDHLMPFAHWPCNDLWNMAPTTKTVNGSKGDRLPSVVAMANAEERLCDWWKTTRNASEVAMLRFDEEVRAALPFVRDPSSESEVFQGLLTLRASLRREQQIPEWQP